MFVALIATIFSFILFSRKNNLVKLRQKISNLAHSCVNSYKPTLHALKKHRILEILASNKDIVNLLPDKGNGTVILNRDEYIKKLSDIISDTSKFKKLSAIC